MCKSEQEMVTVRQRDSWSKWGCLRLTTLVALFMACSSAAQHTGSSQTPEQANRNGGEYTPGVKRLAEPGWVEARASVIASNEESPRSALQHALAEARRKAVEYVSGVSVKSGLVSYRSVRDEEVSSLDQVLTLVHAAAVVVEERLLRKVMTPLRDGGGFRTSVVLHARVVDRVRGGDPGFRVDVDLGGERFRAGEYVSLALRSTRDACLYVIQVGDHGAVLLLPNSWIKKTCVEAGETLEFPGDELTSRGIRLKATLPSGREESVETLVVLALRPGHDLEGILQSDDQGSVFREEESAGAILMLGEFLAPLANVPAGEWAMTRAVYEVWSR